MRKIICLLICMFIVTGCEVNYNLTIGEQFTENISVKEVAASDDDNTYKRVIESGFPLHVGNSDGDYRLSQKIEKGYSYVKADGVFGSSNYNSYGVFSACDNYTVNENDDIFTLKATDFKIFDDYNDMDTLTVNIKTKYNVIKHNADKVKDNTYTWIIDIENYKDKSIYFKYQTKTIFEKKEFPIMLLVSIIIVLAIIFYFGFTYIYKKNKESNEF